jgi:hypothetical protein
MLGDHKATFPGQTILSRVSSQRSTNRRSINYELFNSNNISVHHLSWNYHNCWHQTGPQVVPHCYISIIIHSEPRQWECCQKLAFLVATSPCCVSIVQFARLLPALAVVAISQAASPESNPHSALPVTAIVVPWTTSADRAETRMIQRVFQRFRQSLG